MTKYKITFCVDINTGIKYNKRELKEWVSANLGDAEAVPLSNPLKCVLMIPKGVTVEEVK